MTGTFTVIGVLVAALAVAFLITAVRRRRSRQMDREVAEAAAFRGGFGYEADDDRRPLGGASVYARPSMSTARVSTHEGSAYGAAPQSAYSGYSGGYQVQYGQFNSAPYAPGGAYQNAQYGAPPPMPSRAEPDVYAYNPNAGAAAAAGVAGVGVARTRSRTEGPGQAYPQTQPTPPPHAAAMVPGVSRYAQAQQQQAPDMRQRTPPLATAPAPPPTAYLPPTSPVRQPSATSVQVQDDRDYTSRMDLKVRATLRGVVHC